MSARHVPVAPAIYARISVDKSGEKLGVERQIEACRERAAAMGWPEPVVYHDNDISAMSGKRRPAFERLLKDLATGKVDGLLAWHLDRVLRRVLDLERVLHAIESAAVNPPIEFLKAGQIDLSSASGRMLARILASVAAAESELKSERIKAQKKQEAERGLPPSKLGYGWDAMHRIVSSEAAIIREVAERLLSGESINSVAVSLNDRGVLTPNAGRWDARRVKRLVERGARTSVIDLVRAARGREALTAAAAARLVNRAGGTTGAGESWTAKAVSDSGWAELLTSKDVEASDSDIAVLLSETDVEPDPTAWRASALVSMITRASLAGQREFSEGPKGGLREVVAQGDWPAILSVETSEQLRELFKPGTRKAVPTRKYLLGNILRCSACGEGMNGMPTKHGHRYGCTYSPGRERCGKISIAGPQVDAMVTTLMIDVLADADVRSGARRGGPGSAKIAEAEAELAAVAAMREEFAASAARGGITLTEWKTFRDGLDARQRAAEKVVGAWAPSRRNVLTGVPAARAEIEAWWEAAPVTRRRQIIQAFIDSIPIAPTNPARTGFARFDPSRVGDPVWLV